MLSSSWLSPVLGRMTIQYCGALPIVNHNSGLGEHRPDPQGPNNWCYHQTRNRGHPQTPSTYQRSLLFGNLFKPSRPKMPPWQSLRSEKAFIWSILSTPCLELVFERQYNTNNIWFLSPNSLVRSWPASGSGHEAPQMAESLCHPWLTRKLSLQTVASTLECTTSTH